MIPHKTSLLPSVKIRKEQGALAKVTMGYRSIIALDLVVAPRTSASLGGNKANLTDGQADLVEEA